MAKKRIIIFDTTLRDGEQSPGASLNVDEKLEVARQLAALKVDVMEAGFPISSKGDLEAVKRIAQEVKGPVICGLARAVRGDIDAAWEAVQHAKRPRIHTFVATSDIHLKHKLNKTREQVLEIAVEAVKHAKKYTEDVEFSPEDAVRTDFDYLCQVVEKTIDAGATVINIPDTVGYALPDEFGEMIARLLGKVPNLDKAILSVHCHNDLGLAVANSLAAIKSGATQVECTINGLGERAGNASLEEIVMILRTRKDFLDYTTGVDTRQIYRTSRLVSELTGIVVQPNKAVVGSNAFSHEAGIHQHGVIQEKTTYEIMDAASIGLAESQLVLGKHSGRHAFQQRLRELGYELIQEDLDKAFYRFKELADKKKSISDRDLEAIVADEVYAVPEIYRLDYLHVVAGSGIISTATVRIASDAEVVERSGTGVGPVDAVYKTIAACIGAEHHLEEFRIEAVTGGTDALGEVYVRITDPQGRLFSGRGSSTDVLDASARAYLRALNRLVHQARGQGEQKGPAGRGV